MAKHRKPNDDNGMEESIYCDKCGQKNNPTAKFCRRCGKELPKKRGGTARIVPKGKHRKQ